MTAKPLTNEQLWGEPMCEHKGIPCRLWDEDSREALIDEQEGHRNDILWAAKQWDTIMERKAKGKL
jgi:hypothetical protein